MNEEVGIKESFFLGTRLIFISDLQLLIGEINEVLFFSSCCDRNVKEDLIFRLNNFWRAAANQREMRHSL